MALWYIGCVYHAGKERVEYSVHAVVSHHCPDVVDSSTVWPWIVHAIASHHITPHNRGSPLP
jgi:hypothetical protein